MSDLSAGVRGRVPLPPRLRLPSPRRARPNLPKPPELPPRLAFLARLPYRAAVLVAAVCIAFHFSLETLASGLSAQTPLGFLALVPVIALLVGASSFVTNPRLRPIHDRQLDWIVGAGLLAAAATIELLLPSAYSADFWLSRLDLLGLPFFVAGLIALLYGVRRLWALRWAVLFLFLAWPVPYETFLAGVIGAATDISLSAVDAISKVVPIAQPEGEGTFLVTHAGSSFAVTVGSACSGINSLVGFLLIGSAWNAVLRGSAIRRLAWLGAGFVVVGALNIVRIELILIAGTLLGAPFAFDVLHPVAGLIVFAVGALLMLLLARPFGLDAPALEAQRGGPDQVVKRRAAGPRIRLAAPGTVALIVAALLAVPDGALANYGLLADGFGQPQLAAIDPSTVALAGWRSSDATTFDQATDYFGPHATWERIAFTSADPTAGPDVAYLDVIRTDESSTLSAYGVESCYSFHGFSEVAAQPIDVGAGVEAQLASYRSPNGGTDWSLLWWEWPYSAGTQTRYERLVLLAPVDAAGGGANPAAGSASAAPTPSPIATRVPTFGAPAAATANSAAQQSPAAPVTTAASSPGRSAFAAAEASLTVAGRSIVAQAILEQAGPPAVTLP